MKNLFTRDALRATGRDLLDTIASIPRRRYFWLLLVAVASYSFGYKDAFRGPQSLGWKFGELVDRVTPTSIIDERRRNAEAIRQRAQQGLELPQ
jgi:hypothetical protein